MHQANGLTPGAGAYFNQAALQHTVSGQVSGRKCLEFGDLENWSITKHCFPWLGMELTLEVLSIQENSATCWLFWAAKKVWYSWLLYQYGLVTRNGTFSNRLSSKSLAVRSKIAGNPCDSFKMYLALHHTSIGHYAITLTTLSLLTSIWDSRFSVSLPLLILFRWFIHVFKPWSLISSVWTARLWAFWRRAPASFRWDSVSASSPVETWQSEVALTNVILMRSWDVCQYVSSRWMWR